MVKELEELGIKLMVSIWPTVETGSENYAYMEEMGYLRRTEQATTYWHQEKIQDTYFDATNPDARELVFARR